METKIILSEQQTCNSTNYKVDSQHQDDEFYFQWHITNRCNLRCSHCYQDNYSNSSEPTLEELKNIVDKMDHALTVWRKEGRIAITGGEPFIRKDLVTLLHYMEQKPSMKKIGILTNGTLINDYVDSLKVFSKLYYIQMSLEGNKEKNDQIRGKGVFDKVLESTNLLKKNGISVRWMVTLHKKNVEDVPYLIDLALENNADTLVFERLIPTGIGKSMRDMLLTPDELSHIYNYILHRSDEEYSKGSPLMILKLRTLWVLTDPKRAEKNAYTPLQNEAGASCSVGMDSLCILPDSTVLPCRRLTIPIGNLKTDSLFKIWYTSDVLWDIRNKRNLKGKCNSCDFIPRCSGCRAMAYACTGDYLEEDPQCWM
ncbi:MAG: radical SAM protein [ANME-2 cluster archaeon]|nr:radical SAM protein [ANME-2 cluster archaeon]